jgi:TRAP-type C4-dicarboxylate transport system permease small subunit
MQDAGPTGRIAKERSMKRAVSRVLSGLDLVLQVVCVALLAVVIFAVMWQVLARYVTQDSSAWTSELGSYSFVWLAMLAIALGVRRGRHMVLDIWEYVKYRQWLSRTIDTVATIIVAGALLLLLWFGIEGLGASWSRTAPGLNISTGWVALAVPVGSAIALIFVLEAWWLNFNAGEDEDPLNAPLIYQPEDLIIVKGEV